MSGRVPDVLVAQALVDVALEHVDPLGQGRGVHVAVDQEVAHELPAQAPQQPVQQPPPLRREVDVGAHDHHAAEGHPGVLGQQVQGQHRAQPRRQQERRQALLAALQQGLDVVEQLGQAVLAAVPARVAEAAQVQQVHHEPVPGEVVGHLREPTRTSR